ncbi:hypothetical protein ScPMuIL_004292 [Solemya velum]
MNATPKHNLYLVFSTVVVDICPVRPSANCGPFRGQETPYQVVVDLIDSWKGSYPELYEFIGIIASPGFITAVLVVLCVGTYYMRIVMVGHREMVTLLRQQLTMVSTVQFYLLNMLQNVTRRSKVKPTEYTGQRLMSPQSKPHDSPTQSGRTFIKSVAQAAASGPVDTGSPLTSRARLRRQPDNQSGAAS